MNDTVQTSPAVAAFVAQVRARLGDLTEEEREELLGGLEADLAERLAEGETELGDPAAYAAELRAAAGLEPRPRAWAVRRPAGPGSDQKHNCAALHRIRNASARSSAAISSARAVSEWAPEAWLCSPSSKLPRS